MDKTTEQQQALMTLEGANQEVTTLSREYGFLKDTIEALTIQGNDDLKTANDFRLKVNKFVKTFDEKRKEAVDPYNQHVKKINAIFNNTKSLFDGLLDTLDKKIIPYMQKVEAEKKAWAERKKAEEAAAAEAERKRLEALAKETARPEFDDMALAVQLQAAADADKEIKVKKSVKGAESITYTTKTWRYRITDERAVPAEFKTTDDKKVKALINANTEYLDKGEFAVPGLEFYAEVGLASRGRA